MSVEAPFDVLVAMFGDLPEMSDCVHTHTVQPDTGEQVDPDTFKGMSKKALRRKLAQATTARDHWHRSRDYWHRSWENQLAAHAESAERHAEDLQVREEEIARLIARERELMEQLEAVRAIVDYDRAHVEASDG